MTEYRAGMQAMVDAADSTARADFVRAAEHDPDFAAAHLRRALMMVPAVEDDIAREHFGKALSLRAELGAHDRALLDALTAALRRPTDPGEIERTFGALETMADADARYAACRLRFVVLAQDEAAIKACHGAWQLDDAHAGAHLVEGQALLHADRTEAARSAFAECVRISPSATDCLFGLFILDTRDGKCAEAAALARKLSGVEPEKPAWRADLVSTLVDIGEPPESVEEALKQYLVRLEESDRAIGEAQTRFALAVLRGDFGDAAARAQAWERAVEPENDELPDHWNVFFETWSLEVETGRVRAAGDLAERYQKLRAAWNTSGDEAGGYLVAMRYAGGRLTRGAFEKQRDAWLAKRIQPLSLDDWVPTFGHAIVTSEEARAAVAALERTGVVPSSGLPGAVYYTIGDAYLRAGEPEEAVAFLQRATTSCMALAGPFEQTHAFADLATALAARGDSAGACAALRTVLSRWGKAPASVTAAASRQAWSKLGCSP
jgi:tetratricopeptide (TPR) repeat protein